MKKSLFTALGIVTVFTTAIIPGSASARGLGLGLDLNTNLLAESKHEGIRADIQEDAHIRGWGKIKKEFREVKEKSEDRLEDIFDDEKDTQKAQTVVGTVTATATTTITIKTNKDVMYTVNATNAKIIRRFGAEIALNDIQVNDRVEVRGTVENNVITANKIHDLSLQARHGQFVGNIASVDTTASTFTLTTKDRGTQTVVVTASTTLQKNGLPAVFTDLSAGQYVRVVGVWNSANSVVTAKNVNIIVRWHPIIFQGTVTAKTDTALTVKRSNKALTIYTVDTSKAMFLNHSYLLAGMSDIAIGDLVTIGAIQLNDSTSTNAFVVRDNTP